MNSRLSLQSILIMGSSGFLGRALVSHCRRLGIRTIGVDRPECVVSGDEAPDVWHGCDIACEFDRLPEPVSLAVFAAQGSPSRADDPQVSELFRVNSGGVARTLAVLAAAGGAPLLHCSTGSVYKPTWSPIAESSAVRHDDPYALSKLHAESMDRLHEGRVTVVNLRIFGLYGPRQRQRLIPGLAGRIRRGEPVQLAQGIGGAPDGGLRISLLQVDDAARAMIELGQRLLDGQRLPSVLNLASKDAPDVREMAMSIAGHLGTQPQFQVAAAREGNLVADTTQLASILEWSPRNFTDGIAQTLQADPMLGAA